jgi:hypothetical protein
MTKPLTPKQGKPKARKPQKQPIKLGEVGRPSKFRPEYVEQVYRLSLLGATDKEMAAFFDVSEGTFINWKQEQPEFLQSMTDGKLTADAKVAESLYKRATGYTAKKVVTANIQGMITDIKEVNEYVGPDVAAASLWLRNRQPAKWRDKVTQEVTGPGGGPMEMNHTIEFVKPQNGEG